MFQKILSGVENEILKYIQGKLEGNRHKTSESKKVEEDCDKIKRVIEIYP